MVYISTGVFGVAEYESDIGFFEFKMEKLTWRFLSELAEVYRCSSKFQCGGFSRSLISNPSAFFSNLIRQTW